MTDLNLRRGDDGDDGDGAKKPPTDRTQRRHRADIRERLFAVFSRLADSREGRGDVELAEMIREDSRAMVEGILSATKRAPGLAGVILGALAVIEPLIAFGRIFRMLLGRLADRRARGFGEDELGAERVPEPAADRVPEPDEREEDEPDESAIARPWLDVN